MCSCFWRWLFTHPGSIIPAIIKKNKQGFYFMPVGYSKISIQPLFKAFFICSPQQMMKVYTHYIKAQIFGPAKLFIDGCRIEGFRLEHLQLIYSSTWLKITSSKPALLFIPGVCLFYSPFLSIDS